LSNARLEAPLISATGASLWASRPFKGLSRCMSAVWMKRNMGWILQTCDFRGFRFSDSSLSCRWS